MQQQKTIGKNIINYQNIIVVALILMSSAIASADEIVLEAKAYALNQSDAKSQAVYILQRNLQNKLYSDVDYCNSVVKGSLMFCNTSEDKILSQIKLPLLAVKFVNLQKKSRHYGVKAILSSSTALSVYRASLKNEKEIIINWNKDLIKTRAFKRSKVSDKDISIQLGRYYQLALVASFLGDDSYLQTKFKISNNEPVGIARKFSSIDEAVSHVAKLASLSDSIYVFPPRPDNAVEITPFGGDFYQALQHALGTRSAESTMGVDTLSGQYEIKNGDLLLKYQLYSKEFLLKDRVTLTVATEAFNGKRVKPLTSTFDNIFINKQNSDSGFTGEITTHLGQDDLLFRAGDTIKLFVRLSQPGYFYIVGYINRPDEQYSYLLEINESDKDEKFVGYVGPDQVNQIVELGEFSVEAPYGVEYLQLIAANADIKPILPTTEWDEALGYFVLTESKGNAISTVKNVRGFKRLELAEMLIYESQLAYTTQK